MDVQELNKQEQQSMHHKLQLYPIFQLVNFTLWWMPARFHPAKPILMTFDNITHLWDLPPYVLDYNYTWTWKGDPSPEWFKWTLHTSRKKQKEKCWHHHKNTRLKLRIISCFSHKYGVAIGHKHTGVSNCRSSCLATCVLEGSKFILS